MIIPIKCYSCGTLIANKYKKYKELINEDKLKPQDILEKELNLKKYCCKRMIVYHVDLLESIH